MIVKQISVGPMANFSYLLGDKENKKGLVIDPAWDVEKIIREAEKEGIEIIYIVNTHFHSDHTAGNEEMIKKTKAKLIAHKQDAARIIPFPDITVNDGDTISLGNITLTVIHTPGHSAGGICLLAGNNLFTGDTLFIQGAGRTDLLGGDSITLRKSLDRLKQFDNNLIIYPGHHYGSQKSAPLGIVKEVNPFL